MYNNTVRFYDRDGGLYLYLGWMEDRAVRWLRPVLLWLAVCRNGVDDDLGVCCRYMGREENEGRLRISSVKVTACRPLALSCVLPGHDGGGRRGLT